jgi:hypothetical protein
MTEGLIQAGGGNYVLRSMDFLILFGIRKNCMSRREFYQLYQFNTMAMQQYTTKL